MARVRVLEKSLWRSCLVCPSWTKTDIGCAVQRLWEQGGVDVFFSMDVSTYDVQWWDPSGSHFCLWAWLPCMIMRKSSGRGHIHAWSSLRKKINVVCHRVLCPRDFHNYCQGFRELQGLWMLSIYLVYLAGISSWYIYISIYIALLYYECYLSCQVHKCNSASPLMSLCFFLHRLKCCLSIY